MRLAPHTVRRGMTLFEVLVAMAIFLFSLIAISQLMTLASRNADDVRWQSRATRMAQSKLAEFVAGVQQVSSGGTSGTFDEDPDWNWKADINAYDNVANLYTVTLTAYRDFPNGKHIESVLNEYVLDPNYRGNVSIGSSSSSTSTSTTTSGSGQ